MNTKFIALLVVCVLASMSLAAKAERPDFCSLPSVKGACKAYFKRFAFNPESNQCQEFIYGGCGGNNNKFETEEACNRVCGSNNK